MGIFWSGSIQTVFTDTVLIDGITVSVFLVSMLTPTLSFVSWILLSWTIRRKIIVSSMLTSVLLGIIGITPIAQMSGSIPAIIIGITSGCGLFVIEYWKKRN